MTWSAGRSQDVRRVKFVLDALLRDLQEREEVDEQEVDSCHERLDNIRHQLGAGLQDVEETSSQLSQVCVEREQLEFAANLAKLERNCPPVSRHDPIQDNLLSSCTIPHNHSVASSLIANSLFDNDSPSSSSDIRVSANPPNRIHHASSNKLSQSAYCCSSSDSSSSRSSWKLTSSPSFTQLTSTGNQSVPPRIKTLHSIVLDYSSRGRFETALSLCRQAIQSSCGATVNSCNGSDLEGGDSQSSSAKPVELASLLNLLANVHRDQGDFGEAIALLTEVVTLREQELGCDDPLVAASINNLAILLSKTGRFNEAEPLFRRALGIREKLLGPTHPDIAKQLNNLALVFQGQRKFDEVERCFRKALDIYVLSYKPFAPIVLKAQNNLACALIRLNSRLEEAEALINSVLTPYKTSATTTLATSNSVHGNTQPDNDVAIDSGVFSITNSTTTMTQLGEVIPFVQMIDQLLQTDQSGDRNNSSKQNENTKFDLAYWARKAEIDFSIVLTAVRNLFVLYQRRGSNKHAQLLQRLLRSALDMSYSSTSTRSKIKPAPIESRSDVTLTNGTSPQLEPKVKHRPPRPPARTSTKSNVNRQSYLAKSRINDPQQQLIMLSGSMTTLPTLNHS